MKEEAFNRKKQSHLKNDNFPFEAQEIYKTNHIKQPSNTWLRGQPSGAQLGIQDKLQLFQQGLDQLSNDHRNSMMQINNILEHVKDRLEGPLASSNQLIEKKVSHLQYKLNLMLEQEQQDLEEAQDRIKLYIQGNAKRAQGLVQAEGKQQKQIEQELRQLAKTQLQTIKELINTSFVQSMKSTKPKNRSAQQNLKEKIEKAMQQLDQELISLRQQNVKLDRQGTRLMRHYIKVLEQIEDSRCDRQAKQEQILAKIEEIVGDDPTKQETISRLE